MDWKDLNWLEDIHLGYEEDRAAVFDRNINGWVTVPEDMELPDNQQDRDMIARELLIKFQMSKRHPMVVLRDNYGKFWNKQGCFTGLPNEWLYWKKKKKIFSG